MPVAQGSVERFGLFFFYLYLNVRDAVRRTALMRSFEKGAAGALASGFRAHVEVFDAGEQSAGGDVQAVGEDGYAEYLLSRPGGEYLYVPEFDGLPQTVNELLGYGLAVPEGFL
jgi:hypothetical protein